ncbi:hypothetical protein [Sporolactobacillus sp. THM19-2]|nr:hypothetical protein [Sporolactobacillus sp. THM19-2]
MPDGRSVVVGQPIAAADPVFVVTFLLEKEGMCQGFLGISHQTEDETF